MDKYIIKNIDYQILENLFSGFEETVPTLELVSQHHTVGGSPTTVDGMKAEAKAIDDFHTNVAGLGNIAYQMMFSPYVPFVVLICGVLKTRRHANSNWDANFLALNLSAMGDFRKKELLTPALILTWARLMEDIEYGDNLAVNIPVSEPYNKTLSGIKVKKRLVGHKEIPQVGHGTECPAGLMFLVDSRNKYGSRFVLDDPEVVAIIQQDMALCNECGLFLPTSAPVPTPTQVKTFSEAEVEEIKNSYQRQIDDLRSQLSNTEQSFNQISSMYTDLKLKSEIPHVRYIEDAFNDLTSGIDTPESKKLNEIIMSAVNSATSSLQENVEKLKAESLSESVRTFKIEPSEKDTEADKLLRSFLFSQTAQITSQSSEDIRQRDSVIRELNSQIAEKDRKIEELNSTRNVVSGAFKYGVISQFLGSTASSYVLTHTGDIQSASSIGVVVGTIANMAIGWAFSFWKQKDKSNLPTLAENYLTSK